MSGEEAAETPSCGGDGSEGSGRAVAQAPGGTGSGSDGRLERASDPENGSADRLEQRYRRLLMVLPKAYRTARGEEMLSVLMDAAPEGRRWPAGREVLSLAALGIRMRSGARPGEAPTTETALPLLRAIALAGSLLFTFLAGVTAYPLTWHWSYFSTDINYSDLDGHHHTFGLALLLKAANLLWPVAYAAVILALRRTTYVVAALLTLLIAVQVSGMYTTFAALPAVIVVIAMVAATRGGLVRTASPGRWVASPAVLVVLCATLVALNWRSSAVDYFVATLLPLVAGSVVAAFTAHRSSAWPLALAVMGTSRIGLEYLGLWHFRYWWPEAFFKDPAMVMMNSFVGFLIAVAAYAVIRERLTLAKARARSTPPPA